MHQLVADSDTTDSDTTDSESSSSSDSPAPSRQKPTNKHPQFASYPPLLNVNDMTNSRPPDVYLDRQGRQWTLAAWAKPARFFRNHYPLLGLHMEPDPPLSKKLYFTCQTRGCNFQWMMLKKKGWIFRRHHHNHKLDRQTPAQLLRGHLPGDPAPPDAMADLMKLQGWKLLAANVSTEDQLAGIVLKNAVTRAKKTESEFQYCEPFDCRRSRCNYRIRWLPHRSTVWENGSHNHAITAIVRRRMRQLERKKNLGAGGGQAKGKKAKVKKAKTNKSAPSAGTRKSPRLTRKSPRLLKQLQRGRNKKSNNKGMAAISATMDLGRGRERLNGDDG